MHACIHDSHHGGTPLLCAGNILVRWARPGSRALQLVVLDHGCYLRSALKPSTAGPVHTNPSFTFLLFTTQLLSTARSRDSHPCCVLDTSYTDSHACCVLDTSYTDSHPCCVFLDIVNPKENTIAETDTFGCFSSEFSKFPLNVHEVRGT